MFSIQEAHSLWVWLNPYTTLRAPILFNLRADPFERADHEAIDYEHWYIEHLFVFVPAQAYVGKFLQTFKEFPPRQKPGSFTIDHVLEKLQAGMGD
jgi:arylsulfatase